jgi:hypothetical protein
MNTKAAEKIVTDLEKKREACLRAGVELQDERAALPSKADIRRRHRDVSFGPDAGITAFDSF